MTPKELLYIDDALGHTEALKKVCGDYSSRITDPELKNFVQTLAQKQQTAFSKFYGLL